MFSPLLLQVLQVNWGSLDPLTIAAIVVGLIIMWIIVSIPIYIAGKVVTAGKSTLGDAMIATLFGPIVYVVTLFVVDYFLSGLIGGNAYIVALILAFIAWLWVFKSSFKTGLLGAFALAVLAIFVFVILSLLISTLLGIFIPAPFFPHF